MRKVFDYVKLIPIFALLRSASYSQRGEDLLLKSLVRGKTGSYIDIGSGLPCWGSNTYLFYKLGWKGVLVDPIKRNIILSRFIRKRDRSICGAIGRDPGFLDFYEFQPYEFSTLDEEVYKARVNEGFGKFLRKYPIQVITLKEVLDIGAKSRPLILSIDTEGYEMQILTGYDWAGVVPDLICIEEWNNPIIQPSEIRNFLTKRGYELVIYNGLSSIYRLAKSEFC